MLQLDLTPDEMSLLLRELHAMRSRIDARVVAAMEADDAEAEVAASADESACKSLFYKLTALDGQYNTAARRR